MCHTSCPVASTICVVTEAGDGPDLPALGGAIQQIVKEGVHAAASDIGMALEIPRRVERGARVAVLLGPRTRDSGRVDRRSRARTSGFVSRYQRVSKSGFGLRASRHPWRRQCIQEPTALLGTSGYVEAYHFGSKSGDGSHRANDRRRFRAMGRVQLTANPPRQRVPTRDDQHQPVALGLEV